MSARFTSPQQTLGFALAGRAVLTIKSVKSGDHMTFKVSAAKRPGTVTHFVSLRTHGPDGNFVYLGTINAQRAFSVGRPGKTPFTNSDIPTKVFRFVMLHLANGEMPTGAEIWHEGTCGRCGRALTVPSSIASGLGPECASKTPRCIAA